jgi:hypothetical protein
MPSFLPAGFKKRMKQVGIVVQGSVRSVEHTPCYSGVVVMLYFKPFDLLLRTSEQADNAHRGEELKARAISGSST